MEKASPIKKIINKVNKSEEKLLSGNKELKKRKKEKKI